MHKNFNTRFTLTAAAIGALFSSASPGYAQTPDESVVVTATRVGQKDTTATFASEIHTRQDIIKSGAATLQDYLAQNTSIQVMPSYGNRHSPKIDMRGFGIGDGYQNIVVSLDGVRLNDIDQSSPLLGSIPLSDIDRIEITKGSGSVIHGDGAMAGVIQITTRQHKGGSVDISAGNFGTFFGSANAGMKNEKLALSASATRSNLDGFSAPDASGHKDASRIDNWRVNGVVTPLDVVKFSLAAGGSDIDTRYAGALTQQQLDQNPAQNNGTNYTHQRFKTDFWKAGASLWLSPSVKALYEHHQEIKRSEYVASSSIYDYDYRNDDLSLQYLTEQTAVTIGLQSFDGLRKASNNLTSKENIATFLQGQQQFGDLKLSAGARREKVDYTYTPTVGATLNDNHSLSAWDLGANYRVSSQFSVFSNLNSAYQAPDIDRFFKSGGAFNAFISPARARTLNIGLNHETAANRLKATLFRTWLNNEIYYRDTGSFLTSFNTNIDKSHKYGVELQDALKISPTLKASLNYAYTRAIIDEENEGLGAFNGKSLPGVSRHSVNLGIEYLLGERASASLSHSWRSATWAADDFDNNNAQKQRAYSSTDIAYRRHMKEGIEVFAKIENVFEQTNGIWVADNAIYPTNFARTWRVGMRAQF